MPELPLWLGLILGALVYALVTAVLTVLAHRSHMRTRRHDLLVNIKTRRLEYERQLMDRQRALQADYAKSDVELIEDDPPALAGSITPAGETRAAA